MKIDFSGNSKGMRESLQLALEVDAPHHAANQQHGDVTIFRFPHHRPKLLSINGFVKKYRHRFIR
jgi:hypothetical protein